MIDWKESGKDSPCARLKPQVNPRRFFGLEIYCPGSSKNSPEHKVYYCSSLLDRTSS